MTLFKRNESTLAKGKKFSREVKLNSSDKLMTQQKIQKMDHFKNEKDLIVINGDVQFEKINEWASIHNEKFSLKYLPIKQGSIVFAHDGDWLFNRIVFDGSSSDYIDVEMYFAPISSMQNQEIELLQSKIRIHNINPRVEFLFLDTGVTEDSVYAKIQFLYNTLMFMTFYSETRYIKRESRIFTLKKNKKNSKIIKRMGSVKYILEEDANSLNELITHSRKYIRSIGTWFRRGHYRKVRNKKGEERSIWIEGQYCHARNQNCLIKAGQAMYKP